jgi:uncharacterized protein YkwD
MAAGAVAVSSGLLPGVAHRLSQVDGGTTGTQADGPAPQRSGSDVPSPLGGGGTPTAGRSATTTPGGPPAGTAGRTTARPGPSASPTRAVTSPAAPSPTRTTAAPTRPVTTSPPVRTTPSATAPATLDAVAAARSQILTLVNQQRADAGCHPLTASSSLDTLAQNFSDDMAARGFFDHTDPDGRTPWDRAKALGITNLGGENIARGQADAQAVMTAWMNSPGHRANILNCDYTTLGVGIHFGPGGPWWTQDFGF